MASRTIVKSVAVSVEQCLRISVTCWQWGPERPSKVNFLEPGGMIDKHLALYLVLPCSSREVPESLSFTGFSPESVTWVIGSLPLPSLDKSRGRETKPETWCGGDPEVQNPPDACYCVWSAQHTSPCTSLCNQMEA